MPTRNINLTEYFDRLIEAGVSSGRYGNASEMVREGLRLLEQRTREERAKLKWLRGAVKEGVSEIERGEYSILRSDRDIEDFMRQCEKASEDIAAEPARA